MTTPAKPPVSKRELVEAYSEVQDGIRHCWALQFCVYRLLDELDVPVNDRQRDLSEAIGTSIGVIEVLLAGLIKKAEVVDAVLGRVSECH